MKSSAKSAIATSTINFVKVSSKGSALAFFLASLFSGVYGDSYVSLLLQILEYLSKLRPRSYQLA